MDSIIAKFTCFIIKKAYKYNIPSYDFDDLVQHGYLSVIKAVKLYKIGKGSFTTYCTNSIVNNFNALLKGQIKHFREVQDEGVLSIQPYDFTLEDEVIAFDQAEKIKLALCKLQDIEIKVIKSVYMEGRTLKETAEMLNIKYRHAIEIKKSALNKLKKYLK
ncbi:sigma-70 family RNA polymerase sigma factor [Clostridium ljungdahlii]|nr:sigma-70 family RNA polymerase sigma factor [Clostridium ljungdahlii]